MSCFILQNYRLSQEQFDEEGLNIQQSLAQKGLLRFGVVVNHLTRGVASLVTLVTAFIVIFAVEPLISLLVVAALAPAIIVYNRTNYTREDFKQRFDPDERLSWRTITVLLNPKYMVEIRLLNAFKTLNDLMKHYQKKVNDGRAVMERKIAQKVTAVGFVNPVVNFGINIYFFHKFILNAAKPSLDSFIFMRGVLEETLRAANGVRRSANTLHKTSLELSYFKQMAETAPVIVDGEKVTSSPLTIQFENVSFKYRASPDWVLKNLSFTFKPGQHLALVGANAAGKTTILKLMLRQYLPTSGRVTVNGLDIADLNQEKYYALVSHLSQEFFLIDHLTIKENLLLGASQPPPDEAIWQALNLSQAGGFVKEMSAQLATRLSPAFDNGTDVSIGQRQRLGVARTLLRDAPLMVLDEPTSAIDAVAEAAIFDRIYNQLTGKSVLIVSHRFSTVRRADKILVIEKGSIAEQGSHHQLLDNDGIYKKMFELQAEGYR